MGTDEGLPTAEPSDRFPAPRRRRAAVSDHDVVGDAIERLEWKDRDEEPTPQKRWHEVSRRAALTGGAAGLAAFMLNACGGDDDSAAQSSGGGSKIFGDQKQMKFTFVNHVTTNPFFVPTRYGADDACSLFNCTYQWTGSESANVNEMVNAFNSAISAKVDGIAVSLVDLKAFNGPIQKALDAGIPVVGYNADAPDSGRLSYIGQDLFLSGQEMGKHIVDLVGSGDVALFIATPGSLNIQPRIDGAIDTIKKSGGGITHHTVATGAALPKELSTIDAYWLGHKETKGMFAVDAGSTQGVGQVIKKYNLRDQDVKGGGYDLLAPTIDLVSAGQLDFTIDQQPYLQGFFPVLELFFYKASQTLTGIADVNTGLKFLDQETVKPYLETESRYEGNSKERGVNKA
jgi:simple sugar transport system substrate-binding protein